mmetsp:Transcript_90747/g.207633  ORF Transcript_90747/g.207633 Transcript_90747/m.207633 type:complete len:676 (-) Transcript_90747:131-2158(-)|eukprot:CAMPEP_0204333282 /NCGR_PEP_ID=MMETSP0469-20131031/17095_1 /ASSEMBLY_ACC=CAM_ASM_000384 /TAXON_ID=2969 /ORGANISM="Oxyrrhis marina" /LENGTH=675 /DNA_ID=CAMNT_0051316599 /DNA_START=63 /DNA_END=2090 /DNA_ORIENTATION=+
MQKTRLPSNFDDVSEFDAHRHKGPVVPSQDVPVEPLHTSRSVHETNFQIALLRRKSGSASPRARSPVEIVKIARSEIDEGKMRPKLPPGGDRRHTHQLPALDLAKADESRRTSRKSSRGSRNGNRVGCGYARGRPSPRTVEASEAGPDSADGPKRPTGSPPGAPAPAPAPPPGGPPPNPPPRGHHQHVRHHYSQPQRRRLERSVEPLDPSLRDNQRSAPAETFRVVSPPGRPPLHPRIDARPPEPPPRPAGPRRPRSARDRSRDDTDRSRDVSVQPPAPEPSSLTEAIASSLVGNRIVVDGRSGVVSWHGLPQEAVARVVWDDTGQQSSPIDIARLVPEGSDWDDDPDEPQPDCASPKLVAVEKCPDGRITSVSVRNSQTSFSSGEGAAELDKSGRSDASHSERVPVSNLCWVKGETIGVGSMGQVYTALEQSEGRIIAVKEILIDERVEADVKFRQQLANEVEVLQTLTHEHIVSYLGHDIAGDHMYVYLEYMPGGSIAHVLSQFGPLDESLIGIYTSHIVNGLAYLHTRDPAVLHRDIKGANILVGLDCKVKLSDFGCSKRTNQSMAHTMKGSIPWMAPEVMKGTGYGLKADIWSLGCVLIEMSTADHPWESFDNHIAAMFRIAMSQDTPGIPGHLSEVCQDFISQCVQRDPKERPTALAALDHPFIAHHPRT